jgi:hypothetical protein
MSNILEASRNRRCITATTTEVRSRGLAAIVADRGPCLEVLVTEPGHGWIASVLPGVTTDDLDIQVYATEPAEQWTEDFQEWADAVESLLNARPVAVAA